MASSNSLSLSISAVMVPSSSSTPTDLSVDGESNAEMETASPTVILHAAEDTPTDPPGPPPRGNRGPPPTFHTVLVGKTEFKFEPEVVNADIGDIVVFEFFPKNNSIIRSSWESPCTPYEFMYPRDKDGQIWSGWKPVASEEPESEMPSFQVKVKDNDPRLIYGGAATACNKKGMVMIINPNATMTITDYKKRSMSVKDVIVPGQDLPDNIGGEDGPPWQRHRDGRPGWGRGPPPWATSAPTATKTVIPSSSSNVQLSPGAIAGISIGGATLLAIILLLIVLILKYRLRNKRLKSLAVDGPSFQHYLTSSGAQLAIDRHFSTSALPSGNSPAGYGAELPRNTIIIPLTEAEKERYLERIANRQAGHNRSRSEGIDHRMNGFGTPASPAEM